MNITEQTKDKLSNMMNRIGIALIFTLLAGLDGIPITVMMGFSNCSGPRGRNCTNDEENKYIPPAILVGCIASLFVSIGIIIANTSVELKFGMYTRPTIGTINHQLMNQNMNPRQGYNWGQFQAQPQPYPMIPQNQQRVQPSAPPPDYNSVTSQQVVPPHQTSFPNEESPFNNQTQYFGFSKGF